MQDELAALNGAEPLGNTYRDPTNTSDLVAGGDPKSGASQPVRRQLASNPPPVLDDSTRRRRQGSLGNGSITSKPATTSVRQQRRSSTGFAAPTETSVRRASVGSDASIDSSASARKSVTRKPISRTNHDRSGATSSTGAAPKEKTGLSTAQLDAHTAKTGTSNMLENTTPKTGTKKKPKARKNGWDDDDLESIASSIQSSVRRRRVAPRPLPTNRAPEPIVSPASAPAPVANSSATPTAAAKPATAARSPASPTAKRAAAGPGSPVAPRTAEASNEPGTITTITISDSDSETDPHTGTVSISPMTSGNRSAKQPHPFVQEMDEYNEPVPRKTQPTSFQSPTQPAATAASGTPADRKSQSRDGRAPSKSAASPSLEKDSTRAAKPAGSASASAAKPTRPANDDARRDSNASDGVQFSVEDSDSDSEDDVTNASGRTPLHVLRERAKGEQAMNAMREDGNQQTPVVPPLPLFELSARRDREAAAANKSHSSANAATKPKPDAAVDTDDEETPSLSGDSVSVSTITGTPTPKHQPSRKGTPKVAAAAAGQSAPAKSKPASKPAGTAEATTKPAAAAPAAAPVHGASADKPSAAAPAAEAKNTDNIPAPAPAANKADAKCCVVM